MHSMKTIFAALAALTTLAVAAAPGQGAGRPQPAKGGAPAAKAPGRPSAGAHRAPGKGGHRHAGPGAQHARDRMSHEERRLVDRLEEADGFHEVERLYPHARASRNPYVRAALVDALEDRGERAVNLLAALIADPDEDVADAAFSAWSNIVEDIPWRRRAAVMIEAAAAIQQPAVAVPPPPVPVPVQPVAVPAVPVTTAPVVVAP